MAHARDLAALVERVEVELLVTESPAVQRGRLDLDEPQPTGIEPVTPPACKGGLGLGGWCRQGANADKTRACVFVGDRWRRLFSAFA